MYIEGKAWWLSHLENALQKYNNRVHGTTKMTPFEMSTTQKLIPNKNYNNYKHNKQPKFQMGDYVRVHDNRNLCSKGYTTNWN